MSYKVLNDIILVMILATGPVSRLLLRSLIGSDEHNAIVFDSVRGAREWLHIGKRCQAIV